MSEKFMRTPFEMDSPKAVDDYIELIRNIVQQEISKAPFNRMIPATVVNVGSGVVDVQLNGESGTTITNVPNKTGLTLSNGNQVYVLMINNSSSNFAVTIKK